MYGTLSLPGSKWACTEVACCLHYYNIVPVITTRLWLKKEVVTCSSSTRIDRHVCPWCSTVVNNCGHPHLLWLVVVTVILAVKRFWARAPANCSSVIWPSPDLLTLRRSVSVNRGLHGIVTDTPYNGLFCRGYRLKQIATNKYRVQQGSCLLNHAALTIYVIVHACAYTRCKHNKNAHQSEKCNHAQKTKTKTPSSPSGTALLLILPITQSLTPLPKKKKKSNSPSTTQTTSVLSKLVGISYDCQGRANTIAPSDGGRL